MSASARYLVRMRPPKLYPTANIGASGKSLRGPERDTFMDGCLGNNGASLACKRATALLNALMDCRASMDVVAPDHVGGR